MIQNETRYYMYFLAVRLRKVLMRGSSFGFLAQTDIVQKYIWDCKLRKHLPIFEDLKNIVKSELITLKKICGKFNDSLQSCSLQSLK